MSDAPRATKATHAASAAAVATRRQALPSGWWGMALLVATELTLFGSLIATYFYLRFESPAWPPAGIEDPSVTLPFVYTGILVATVLPVLAAARAAGTGRRVAAWALIAFALVVQATYLGLQIDLFVADMAKFRPDETAYGSIYFTLLGLHHAHVAVGLALDAWLLAVLVGGLTNYRLIALRAIALYWCFVAAIAIPVVLTQLYPSL